MQDFFLPWMLLILDLNENFAELFAFIWKLSNLYYAGLGQFSNPFGDLVAPGM